MGNRRYNRKTNAFSKTHLNHERHLALWIMYHNLCWVPRPSRPPKGETGAGPKQWVKRLPAAIAAGIETSLWEIEDILRRTDEFTAERQAQALAAEHEVSVHAEVVVEVGEDEVCLAPSHWVYRSHVHHSTKVHAAGCCNCRDGQGKKGGAQASGDWLPFYSLDTAKIAAEKLEPDRTSICNMCLGSYRSLGYLGPRPASPTAVNRLGSG